MIIGVLGIGFIGSKIAIALCKAGHTVKVANSRAPDTVPRDIVASGVTGVWAKDAVVDVDVIILSLPPTALQHIAPLLADVPKKVAVLDTFNYYPARDGTIDAIEQGQVESIWSSEQVGRPVTKAWNTLFTSSFDVKAKRPGSEGRVALPVAGDVAEHKSGAIQLVSDTGYDGYDAGSLADSWRLQPGAPCYCTDLTLKELPDALAKAERHRLPKRRDIIVNIFSERTDGNFAHLPAEWAIQMLRLVSLA